MAISGHLGPLASRSRDTQRQTQLPLRGRSILQSSHPLAIRFFPEVRFAIPLLPDFQFSVSKFRLSPALTRVAEADENLVLAKARVAHRIPLRSEKSGPARRYVAKRAQRSIAVQERKLL